MSPIWTVPNFLILRPSLAVDAFELIDDQVFGAEVAVDCMSNGVPNPARHCHTVVTCERFIISCMVDLAICMCTVVEHPGTCGLRCLHNAFFLSADDPRRT